MDGRRAAVAVLPDALGAAGTDLRARCDAALAAFLDRQGAGWPDQPMFATVREFVLAGGKRLRPLFCFWGWRGAGGADSPEIVRAAAALELFHAFALIHDDIMDRSELRRGAPTMHRRFADEHGRRVPGGDAAQFGIGAALLCGDLCAAWADQMLAECGLPVTAVSDAQRVFATMRAEAIAGQYLDLRSGADGGSVAAALRVIRLKAARYTVTRPLEIGAALCRAPESVRSAYHAFGDPVGDAFQLRDDVLGLFGDPVVTGKPALDDLREGKRTVLLALTRQQASAAQIRVLDELVGDPALDEAAADEVRAIVVACGARQRVEQMIREKVAAAGAALSSAPVTPEAADALAALALSAVDRDF